jgi:predicted phage terminase large subunit-like protein
MTKGWPSFCDNFGKIIRAAPVGTKWVRYWDLAGTELKKGATRGARTAGVKLGRTPDGRFVVGHALAATKEGAEVRRIVKATAEMDTVDVEIGISQDPGQAGKEQVQSYIAMLAGFNARRHIESGDKATRAEPFSAQCEIGNVYLIEGAWNQEYIDELCMFGPGAARKDMVDASSGAFGRLVILGEDAGGWAGAEMVERDSFDDVAVKSTGGEDRYVYG